MKRIVQLSWDYQESNPDVGMGPSYESIIQNEANALGVELSEAERQFLVKELESNGYY